MSSAGPLVPALEALGLSKRYWRGTLALDDVSLAVVPGSITALVGPNAAGSRWGNPDRYLGYGFQMPDGRFLPWDEARAATPAGEDPDQWMYDNLPQAYQLLMGTHLTEVEIRESLVLGGVVVAGLAGTFLVVGRRRPY